MCKIVGGSLERQCVTMSFISEFVTPMIEASLWHLAWCVWIIPLSKADQAAFALALPAWRTVAG